MSDQATSHRQITVWGRLLGWYRARHSPPRAELAHHVDEFSYFQGVIRLRGWAFHPLHEVAAIEYRLADGEPTVIGDFRLASPDLTEALGAGAGHCRFEAVISEPDPDRACQLGLAVTLASGESIPVENITARALNDDPFHQLVKRFFASLAGLKTGSILELGARNRSGNVRREYVPDSARYVGFDIVPGENVDVVGDAHELSGHFEPDTFDVVFSMSTFEHLLMPWKVALEINRVLRPGGLVFTTTHQTYPLHEEPWDFWRFSSHSWAGIFNSYTGFEVVETAMGEPASVVARMVHPIVAWPADTVMLASASLCRKTSPPSVTWEADARAILGTTYPTEESPGS